MALFTYITDLPPPVRQTLDVRLQEVLLKAYNQAHELTGSETEAWKLAWLSVFREAFPGEIPTVQAMPAMQPVVPMGGAPPIGYLSDLRAFQFDDGADAGWIQAMPFGSYDHPVYGKIDFTPERAQRFATNVNDKVRDTDLDVDYDHKEVSGEAAGWIKKAEVRDNGLWVFVEWTKQAAQKIREKAYRYFSPEFKDEWTHPKKGVTYKDVLFGGGLTNRPFLKDILPVNLSEVLGGDVDPKKLRISLGLPEDATDEQVQAKIDERIAAMEADAGNGGGEAGGDGGGNSGEGAAPPPPPTGEADNKEAEKALLAEARKLAEDNPTVKKLMERLDIVEAGARLSEVNVKLNEMSNPANGKYAVPPAVIDKLRTLATSTPKKFGDQVLELVAELQTTGLIELGERGKSRGGENTSASATEEFNKLVAKKMGENTNLDTTEALERVAEENPQLYTEYRKESYVREGM